MSQSQSVDDPAQRILELLAGKWVVSALCTAVSLGVFDALNGATATSGQLASQLSCHEPSLRRLLEVLVAEGVLEEPALRLGAGHVDVAARDDGVRYGLTPLGRMLCGDRLGALARFVGSRSQWTPWADLAHSLRTGEAAFQFTHGHKLFEFLADHPEESRIYDDAVDAFTRHEARALADAYDFSTVDRVIDVGGGRGTLLVELLRRWPDLHGVLVDLQNVVAAARQRLAEEFGERCDVVAADFRHAVPPGAHAYVIKRVLHNWDDEQALGILQTCARAMDPQGHVLIVEGILLPSSHRDVTRLLDLEMLVLTDGGRERRKPEFRALLRRAGLRLVDTRPLSGTTKLMVAARA